MAKAKDIKINQSTPVMPINQQTNSTTTGTQNTIPTTTTTPQNSGTWDVDRRGLAQQFIDTSKADWKQAWEEFKNMFTVSPEVRPQGTFEETAWGWNYGMDRAVSQTNNQQWQYNALQGTWHVAWIPQNNVAGLNIPEQQRWKTFPVRPATPENTVVEQQVESVQDYVEPQETQWVVSNTSWTRSGRSYQTQGQAQAQTGWSRFRNANINLDQYWDDSSPDNQSIAWGRNEKYTWEWVKTSNLAYDPNITTADLDPNYLYWMDAQYANSDNAWYIARRNDMIASALYNEAIAQWRNPTKDDVINFLSKQKNWNNSTEADRFNTIESVWKRLGGIANENPINNPAQPWLNNEQPTYSDEALNNMQQDLNKSTAWELYGKATADQNTAIKTLEDDNSVYRAMNDARIQNYKQLRWMDSQAIAAAVVSGVMAMDSQQMRDLMQYDPAKYEYVQQSIKQLRGQMNINSITSGEWDWNTVATNWSSSLQNEKTSFATSNANWVTSTADILKSVNSTLNSNDIASTASEQMASIESDMATLQNRMKNLKKEASQVFKWDVPQYIVNAYVSNRTQEIQDQLSILENRYKAAQTRYQDERERTKRAAEFDLKKQEFELKKQNAVIDNWAKEQGIALKWADANWTTNWVTKLSTLSVQDALNTLSDFSSSYPTNSHWWQCWAFVKKYLANIGVNLPNMSSIDSKKSLIDSSITDPSDWDVVIMSSKNYPQNWHMAIVESVDDDGTIHLLESNWNWDEQVHRRTIKPWDKSILWYYRPTGWTQWTSISWQQWWNWTRRDGETFNLNNAPTYNSLSYDQQNTVKWLLNLSINPATITKRQYWDDFEKILSAVTEINPNWQAADFWQADKVKKEWNTSTKNGSNSRNGTAIATAKELYEMSDLLWNTKFTDWNNMMNYLKKKLSNENFIRFRVKLWTLASEYAWALKGNNAAPTEKEIEEARQQIAENLSGWGIKAAAIEMTRSLYNKNANEADNYANVTLEKPNLIVTEDVANWMYDVAWITSLPEYYNYTPSWWWAVASKSNSWGGTNSTYSPQMTQNLFNY